MKCSTAIRHLVEMADVATEQARLGRSGIGWPLDEMWVAGELIETAGEIDHGTVLLMIDLPPDELPWLRVHPTAEWVGEQLRLGKRQLSWTYRPSSSIGNPTGDETTATTPAPKNNSGAPQPQ